MSNPSKNAPYVPSLEELKKCVVPRCPVVPSPSASEKIHPRPAECRPADTSHSSRLSPEAEAFLRHVAQPENAAMALEEHWQALGIHSGSQKQRILNEVRRPGFIRLEHKGRLRVVHLYNKAWEYLGIKAPTGEGTGGTVHRMLASRAAAFFKKRGYDVRIEYATAPSGKRVDIACFGPKRIGIEIAVTDVRQELRNLRADLGNGVFDIILVLSPDPSLLEQLRKRAEQDPEVRPHLPCVRFHYFDGEVAS